MASIYFCLYRLNIGLIALLLSLSTFPTCALAMDHFPQGAADYQPMDNASVAGGQAGASLKGPVGNAAAVTDDPKGSTAGSANGGTGAVPVFREPVSNPSDGDNKGAGNRLADLQDPAGAAPTIVQLTRRVRQARSARFSRLTLLKPSSWIHT